MNTKLLPSAVLLVITLLGGHRVAAAPAPAPALPTVEILPAVLAVPEHEGPAVFRLHLSAKSAAPVSVNWTILGGTATPGDDYSSATGDTATFDPGVTELYLPIQIHEDSVVEGDEMVLIGLSNPSGANLGTGSTAKLVIQDNDSPPPVPGIQFAQPAGYTVMENGGAAPITISRTGDLSGSSSVEFKTADMTATAGLDYTSINSVVSFAPGESQQIVSIPINWDTLAEPDEFVQLSLSNPTNASLGSPSSSTLTIVNVPHSVPPLADLELVTSGNPANLHPGDLVTLGVSVFDRGPNAAPGVVVADLLPGGFAFVSATDGQGAGSYSPLTGEWQVGDVLPGQTRNLLITARATLAGTVANVAEIIHAGVPDPDSIPGNHVAGEDDQGQFVFFVNPAQADLSVTKTALTNNVPAGTAIPFRIEARNLGPDPATNVVVTEILPASVTLGAVTPPAGTAFDPATRKWSIGRLAAGASAVLTLELNRATAGTSTNRVTIVATGPDDPAEANNAASAVVTWIPPGPRADLKVTKTVVWNPALPTAPIHFNIEAENLGPDRATNVVVQETLPAGTSLSVVAYPGGTTWDMASSQWKIPLLAAGAKLSIDLGLNWDPNKKITNKVTISAASPPDPVLANNTNTVVAVLPTFYRIAGVIKECRTNGAPLPSVFLYLTSTTSTNVLATVVSDASGGYSFPSVQPGDYKVIPYLATYALTPTNSPPGLYTFTPSNAVVKVVAANITTNFVGQAFFIRGRVTEAAATNPLVSISILLSGPQSRTNVTDTNGWFLFTNLVAGQYTVRPLTNSRVLRFTPTNVTAGLGAVTNCTNIANFTGEIRRVELVALQICQAVQDWSNNIPVVKDKATTVRAHLQPAGTNTAPVLVNGARLKGTRGGTVLGYQSPTNGTFLARTNAAQGHTNMARSLNFRLPAAWLDGTVELAFEWTNGVVVPREPPEPGGIASNAIVIANFRPMPELPVKWVAVTFTNRVGTNRVTNAPTVALRDELRNRLISAYPIASASSGALIDLFWPASSGAPVTAADAVSSADEDRLFALIDALRIGRRDTNANSPIFYGIVTNTFVRGQGTIGGNASYSGESGPWHFQRNICGHEIGHNLGRQHAVNRSYGTNANGSVKGRCNEVSSRPSATVVVPDFPMSAYPGYADTWPALGPLDKGPTNLVVGYDHYASLLVNPYFTFDMMSYCGNINPIGGGAGFTPWKWPSRYTYTNLMNAIINRFGPRGAPAPASPPQPAPYLFVRGLIDLESGAVELQPFYTTVQTTTPDSPPPGPYTVRLLDPFNQILGSIPFDIPDASIESDEEEAPTKSLAHFIVPVPHLPTLASIHILLNDAVLAARSATPNAPMVQVLSPVPGQVVGTEPVFVSWSAFDLDGGALHYLVQFSADDGVTWDPLGIDLEGTSMVVDPSRLRGTSQARIRVLATDDFTTGIGDMSGTFTAPNQGPRANLLRPSPGELFGEGQQLVLEASVLDTEDGELDGASVRWSSDLGGNLGDGQLLLLDPDQLPEGDQELTVTATDSAGASVTRKVPIRIQHRPVVLLTILRDGSDLLLTWPALSDDLRLEYANEVEAEWLPVGEEPDRNGDEFVLRVLPSSEVRFFRLSGQ